MGRTCNTEGERRGAYSALVGKPEKDYLEDQGVDRKITLKWVFDRQDEGT